MKDLTGRWVAVTGAGSGIGAATALHAARKGANVAICDIQPAGLAATEKSLRELGVDVIAAPVDVADADDVQGFADTVHAATGSLDVLVNNAGVVLAGEILDTTLEDWGWMLGVNLMGIVHGCAAFAPNMRSAGRGHIVNIASMEGFAALAGFGAYNASKFAAVGYTDTLRQELAPHGVGVSVVCPGVIATPLTKGMPARGRYAGDVLDRINAEHDKRASGPDKVANAVFRAVARDIRLLPVAPEAWMTYYSQRLSPGLTTWILTQVAHRVTGGQ